MIHRAPIAKEVVGNTHIRRKENAVHLLSLGCLKVNVRNWSIPMQQHRRLRKSQ